MVFDLQLFVSTITVKISVFFRFPSNSKELKKWEHLSRLNSLIDTNVIAIVNKKPWTALCHLTNELVPLNGRIVYSTVACFLVSLSRMLLVIGLQVFSLFCFRVNCRTVHIDNIPLKQSQLWF